MTAGIDLDTYLDRIGCPGIHRPDLDSLRTILLHHTTSIPFENLNPLLGLPVPLDPPSLQRKLVADGRGGYCFEQNLLLAEVLRTLGFQVSGLAARVLWQLPKTAPAPRTHMLLRVELNGDSYLADVGFGVMTVTAPLRLQAGTVQETPHEHFCLQPGDNDHTYRLQVYLDEDWKTLYAFDLVEQHLSDYEIANWYLSNHPDSKFVRGLIAARPDRDRRYTLHDNVLSTYYLDGRTERLRLTSAAELRDSLETTFKITLPDNPDLDGVLGRLCDG